MRAMTCAVPVVYLNSAEEFRATVYPTRRPTVLKGVSLGPAPSLWTPQYLASKCGIRPVKIHVSPVPQMDFIQKNFAYSGLLWSFLMHRTLPFDEFVQRASQDKQTDFFMNSEEKYYLRAIGDNPRKDVADFPSQFPELAGDLILPLFCTPEQYFSSVLRIGSPQVQLWTHYDVMDNLLVQVTGKKKVVLFSPQDASNLYLCGDKSQVLDVNQPNLSAYPLFAQATHHECQLEAGDILFVPALWFHNVISLDFSVAVNVFWRHLDPKLYDSRDTYGNKDPLPVQRAQQSVDRAIKALEELPEDYRDFYARYLVSRIESKAYVRMS